MSQPGPSETISLVIFGASGDLTGRKLIPALFNLYCKQRLPDNLQIVGTSRRPYSHDEFRAHLRAAVQEFAADIFDPGVGNIRSAPLVPAG